MQSLKAIYNNFVVADESDFYQLTVGNFDSTKSTTGNGMAGRSWKFSTTDDDNDKSSSRHCADLLGGGFWYGYCNSWYNDVSVTGSANKFGWKASFGVTYLLQQAEMYVCQ